MQTKQRLDVPLQLKSVSESGEFEGYGSVFGVKDSYDDIVVPGAFASSLAVWKAKTRCLHCSGSIRSQSRSGSIQRCGRTMLACS